MNKTDNLLPAHVGVIMDGNRRWAKANGLSSFDGHLKGYENMRDLAIYALREKGVPFLSAYAFSTENWNRTPKEVKYLMNLVHRALTEYLDDFHSQNIRLLALGTREKLSPKVIKAIESAEETTKNNTGGTLALCFNYGGHKEIVDATRQIIKDGLKPDEIDERKFETYLYHPEVPPVDLVIRTSGEERLSGFMLWRASYSEFLFVDKHWPEFDKSDIDAALDEYAHRQRRFGA